MHISLPSLYIIYKIYTINVELPADAKNKAEQIAKLAGVTLGKPTYVSEGAQYSPVSGGYANSSISMSAAVPAVTTIAPPISAGETRITLNVQVAYDTTQ